MEGPAQDGLEGVARWGGEGSRHVFGCLCGDCVGHHCRGELVEEALDAVPDLYAEDVVGGRGFGGRGRVWDFDRVGGCQVGGGECRRGIWVGIGIGAVWERGRDGVGAQDKDELVGKMRRI